MDGQLSQGGQIPGGGSYVGLDLQCSMRTHHHHHHHQTQNPHTLLQQQQQHQISRQGSIVQPSIHNCDRTLSMVDYNKGEKCKNSVSDEDEEGVDCHVEASRGKKGSPWQRVKWTDKMVRLLITAVMYIGEDVGSDCDGGMRRKFSALQKKGKWKSVSKVMAERDYHVSPQQCEDKFNDLNKRYKKLNDMLRRGTSCQVVENPKLLDVIDYLTEKEKDDVRKILSSKQLFYEEMCSYHNGNHLHLPHDPALQHSLQEALRNRDDHDPDDLRGHHHDDVDEDDNDMDTDEHDDFEENNVSHGDNRGVCSNLGDSMKRLKHGQGSEDNNFGGFPNAQDHNKSLYPHPQIAQGDINQALPDSTKAAWSQKQWIESRSAQLEEQKLQIQVELLELEKERLKWKKFSKKRDRELEKMKIENERMKLENERMALELKKKEMDAGFS